MTDFFEPTFEISKADDKEEKFPGEEYYVLNLNSEEQYFDFTNIIEWCYENIGGRWQLVDDNTGPAFITFADETTAMAFKLRWT